jgi:nucleoside-diphosphate-sugar epimerase
MKPAIKTVLITGGAGFIGSHIVDLLLENNYRIVILERSGTDLCRIAGHLKKVKIYYSTKEGISEVFLKNKIDCVIHLATRYLKTHQGLDDVDSIVDTNIKFSSQLLELCLKTGVKYFINTGTFFEYRMKKTPINEEDPKQAYNLYAASKLAFEEILKFYADSFNIKIIDFKLFAPFGDRDNDKLMSYLVQTLNSGQAADFSGGEQKWNFTYVKDIAQAYLSALKNFNRIKKYELVNVGYEKAVSIKQVAAILEKISGKKFKLRWGAKPYSKNEIYYANADIGKLKKLLHYRQKYTLEEGLMATYEYFSLERSKK